MNTGNMEIKPFDQLTQKEIKSGKWIELSEKEGLLLDSMNRKGRREWLKKNRKFNKGKWGFLL